MAKAGLSKSNNFDFKKYEKDTHTVFLQLNADTMDGCVLLVHIADNVELSNGYYYVLSLLGPNNVQYSPIELIGDTK